jgi:hypothetical protein
MNPNARNLDFAGNAPRMKGESDMRDEGMQDSGKKDSAPCAIFSVN